MRLEDFPSHLPRFSAFPRLNNPELGVDYYKVVELALVTLGNRTYVGFVGGIFVDPKGPEEKFNYLLFSRVCERFNGDLCISRHGEPYMILENISSYKPINKI